MGGKKPQLSLWEIVSLIATGISVVTNILLALFTYPFISVRPAGLTRAVASAAVRALNRRATIRQTQAIAPDSEEAYAQAAKAKGFTAATITLDDGTKAHWIGESTASKVLLFFHGGGYVMFASVMHYTALYTNVVARSGSDTSVLLLSYDMAPQAPYPRQIQQAALALQRLLKSRSPSSIIVGGDSAGGNLTAALLAHLAHPHPSASIPRITLQEPLLGALLISPWVGFDISRASYQQNEPLDIIPVVAVQRWSNAYMGDAKADNYNQPVLPPASWWRGVPVKDVLITGGDEEVLIDEIREFAQKFKEAHPNTRVLIAQGEAHDSLLGCELMGLPPSESPRAAYAFIAAL